MKKICVMVLLIIFALGSTCFASATKIYVGDDAKIFVGEKNVVQVHDKDKRRHDHDRDRHDRDHHKKHHKHHGHDRDCDRDHDDDDDDVKDIITGILIYGIIKDIVD